MLIIILSKLPIVSTAFNYYNTLETGDTKKPKRLPCLLSIEILADSLAEGFLSALYWLDVLTGLTGKADMSLVRSWKF